MSDKWEHNSARWDGDSDYLSKGNQRLYLEFAGDYINELEAQLAEARELLEKADTLLDAIDTLDYLALWADKEWHQGRDELITAIAMIRARSE